MAYPRVSNLDEFQPLRNLPGVRLRWARSAADIEAADWLLLPGSKHTLGDLAWLRAQELDTAITRHAQAGGRVLGVCGGLQMLGEVLSDPLGVDAGAADGVARSVAGLGLLPLATHFDAGKLLRRSRVQFEALEADWAALSTLAFDAYEIRHGRTLLQADAGACTVALRNADGAAIGWRQGAVLGFYAHGVFESPEVLRALFGCEVQTLDAVCDGLADFVDRHFERGCLTGLLGVAAGTRLCP